jgi:hypothetical protein
MKIEEAIKILKEEKKNGTKNIILAYWKAEDFDRKDNKGWKKDVDILEEDLDWSNTNEDMQSFLDSLK